MACPNNTCTALLTKGELIDAFKGYPTKSDIDAFWLITNGQIVFLMQIGFYLLEVGSVRAHHAKAICVKNVIDFLITTISWLTLGYAWAFGETGGLGGFAGTSKFFAQDIGTPESGSIEWANWFFQWTFASATCTIVSGAGAERCAFKGYLVSTVMLSLFVYPVIVHWVWSKDNWLSNGSAGIEFYDFAGSGVVHLTGGTCAFMMAWIVGPRDGRFDADGNVHTLAQHNLVLATLGTLLLVMGWFGFNGGSVLAASDGNSAMAGRVCIITAIGAATGGIASLGYVYATRRFILLEALTNGMLGGLVSVTAGGNVLHPHTAAITGLIGGFIYVAGCNLLLKLHVDDPLEASPIHGMCGIWGLIAVGLFANGENGIKGAFYGNPELLGHQLVGALVISTFAGGILGPIFAVMRHFKKLRVPLSIELSGDLVLYGGSAYPQFEKGNASPPDGELCAVCTDVQGAEALWEWDPEVMTVSVEVYKRILTDSAARDHGYEVEGDECTSTMVFHNAFDATKYAVDSQQELMKAEWPPALLDHPSGLKDSVWSGLRIKMAVNVGFATKSLKNHSLWYSGAAIETCEGLLNSMDMGGVIVMSTDTLGKLQGGFSHRLHELGEFTIEDIGRYQIENVPEQLSLIQLGPKHLHDRGWTEIKGQMIAKGFNNAPGAVGDPRCCLSFCLLAPASKAANTPENVRAGADLLNQTTFAHGGYVTKTSNNVSLLAFPNSQNGINFVADMFQKMQEADFKAFKFAAGLHSGIPISVAPNKASGRADYLGPVVNCTARLMALAGDKPDIFVRGNCMAAVSVDTWNEIAEHKDKLHEAGKFELKGVSEGMKTYMFEPAGAEANAVRRASTAAEQTPVEEVTSS